MVSLGVFFFKQKTAYEMRISDWSSDVCSSDLIELIGDMTALRVALNALDTDSGDAPSCARAQGVFAQQLAAGGRFMIVDRLGRVLCGSNLGEGLAIAAPAVAGPISTRIIPDRGLVMRSEEQPSELQSLMRRSYAVYCLKQQKRPE